MQVHKKYRHIALTAVLAVFIGHMMEFGVRLPDLLGGSKHEGRTLATSLVLNDINFVSATAETMGDPSARVKICRITTDVAPLSNAVLQVAVKAPCWENHMVNIHFDGLKFATRTDAQGNLMIDLPVMRKHAFLMLDFGDDTIRSIYTDVPQLSDFDRIAIAWKTPDDAIEYKKSAFFNTIGTLVKSSKFPSYHLTHMEEGGEQDIVILTMPRGTLHKDQLATRLQCSVPEGALLLASEAGNAVSKQEDAYCSKT